MESFELPDDITALSREELGELLEAALAAFDTRARSDSVTSEDLEEMHRLANAADTIRQEQADRQAAAEEAAAEIDELAARVRGQAATDPDADAGDGDGAGDDGGGDEPEPEAAADTEDAGTEPVVAAARSSRTLDLSGIRRRQPQVLPAEQPRTTITAAVDVPGFTPGSAIDFGSVTDGIISRANALKTAGGGVGQVISYSHPFARDMVVTDSSSAPEGSTVIMRAAEQRRLPQGDLVASGGWCAPSETIYDILDISCPDMLWDAPEIQLTRGGLRYFLTPPLDVAAMTFLHTEADDIAGAEKPCFQIPCPEPVEVRCDAVGVCIESGILTRRFFPELVDWYLRNAMVAHELRVKQVLLEQAVAQATQVEIAPTFAALSAVYSAVALQVSDMVERYSLCDRISLEVVFPWWARNLFLSDIARQNGVNVCDLDPSCIANLFATLGVNVQFARGMQPAVPDQIGGATPATEWPTDLSTLIYPAGALQIGRGEEINLGTIYDSNKFVTNDHTALFSEECVALVNRGPEVRNVTIPICPSGETGAQTLLACAASESPGSPAESPAESPA